MKAPDRREPESIQVRVDLAILGEPFRHEFVVPRAPIRPIRMLPVFQAVTDEMMRRAASAATQDGKSISCKAGCGACCRQLVPISETEARHLAALVDAMPEPRRGVIRARFAEVRGRFEVAAFDGGDPQTPGPAGLWERLLAHASLSEDETERLGLDYFHARVPCPFLEDEACSIHPDRPLSCREFLVTSPAEHCADPTPETIEPVAAPSHPSDALARIDPQPATRGVYWIPLVFALDFAAAHPDERPPRPALDHLNTFLGLVVALASDDAGETPPAPGPRSHRRDARKKKRRRA